jgi:hypothetical protein
MDRVAESSAQSRESLARRLELSALRIDDERVTGTIDGFEVALLGEPPFRECQVTLGGALPLSLMRFEHGDLNHVDAVETGDPAFDEAMQVIALPGHAPTLEHVLADADLRTHVLTFLRRFPDSLLRGSTLVFKPREGVTHETLTEAVSLARAVSKRFAHIGFVTTEKPPVVEATADRPKPRTLAAAVMGGLMLVSWWVYADYTEAGRHITAGGTIVLLCTILVTTWLASRDE